MKFGTEINSGVLYSMMLFTFSAVGQKNPFWVNLIQKLKIACSG